MKNMIFICVIRCLISTDFRIEEVKEMTGHDRMTSSIIHWWHFVLHGWPMVFLNCTDM